MKLRLLKSKRVLKGIYQHEIAKEIGISHKSYNFKENGNIFEKYNVVEGNINIVQEAYGKMPAMLGWSAAVYLYAKAVLDS